MRATIKGSGRESMPTEDPSRKTETTPVDEDSIGDYTPDETDIKEALAD